MSHYYYTPANVFFVGILFSFGLVLISYTGYKEKPGTKKLSDDQLTTLAGICALITVIVPTSCCDSGDTTINCTRDFLFGHTDKIYNGLHLISAGLFIVILGWMCVKKFTLGDNEKLNKLYRICGYIVWSSVGLIALIIALDKLTQLDFDKLLPNYVFVLEAVALYSFAIAWLLKGHIDEDIAELKNRLLKKKPKEDADDSSSDTK